MINHIPVGPEYVASLYESISQPLMNFPRRGRILQAPTCWAFDIPTTSTPCFSICFNPEQGLWSSMCPSHGP